jgi:O-antigen ligase
MAIRDSSVSLVIGLGPGNYAGVAAAAAIHQQPKDFDALPRAAREVLVQEPGEAGAAAWATNTWSTLLAEFGLVGFGVFGAALGRVVPPIYRWNPPPGFDRRAQTLFFVMFSLVLWQGSFTPYTNWAEPVLVYPMMVVAAYCHTALGASLHSRSAS